MITRFGLPAVLELVLRLVEDERERAFLVAQRSRYASCASLSREGGDGRHSSCRHRQSIALIPKLRDESLLNSSDRRRDGTGVCSASARCRACRRSGKVLPDPPPPHYSPLLSKSG